MRLFTIPAIEAFPEIKADYGKVIKNPMDFRTITEERVHEYQEISELQSDLSLCFSNCMIYNHGTEFESAAR